MVIRETGAGADSGLRQIAVCLYLKVAPFSADPGLHFAFQLRRLQNALVKDSQCLGLPSSRVA